MTTIKTHFDAEERPYTALYGHFAYKNFGIYGDSAVAFVGPAEVRGDDLVDLADLRAGEHITAARMLHFVVEHFGVTLPEMVWRQRVLAALVREEIDSRARPNEVTRVGDDVFVEGRKLTVSIATVSPTSALIHLGVNVDGTGAPVAVADLNELGIDAAEFAAAIMKRYCEEVEGFIMAISKVRGVC
ncbi:MAG: DUF366 family protein [Candidatus Zixiibacteriota bacterium]|jgi:hypothetical protein